MMGLLKNILPLKKGRIRFDTVVELEEEDNRTFWYVL